MSKKYDFRLKKLAFFWLQLASYYRRFVKDFSQIVRPMVQLTKKGVDFIWSDVCKQSFEEIKSILISAPVMSS
jgi:nucleoside permease NupC